MADVTITIPQDQVQRLQDAFTFVLEPVDENGDPRQADLADLKGYIIADLKQFVRSAEKRAAAAARVVAPDPDLG